MNSVFVDRIIRACKLDVNLYEEVEADKSATLQAALVVVLSSLAAGVGAISLGASNFLMAPILSLISWYIWAYLIYFIGAKLFPEANTKADHGQLLRTIGFSSAPGLIRIFDTRIGPSKPVNNLRGPMNTITGLKFSKKNLIFSFKMILLIIEIISLNY